MTNQSTLDYIRILKMKYVKRYMYKDTYNVLNQIIIWISLKENRVGRKNPMSEENHGKFRFLPVQTPMA